MSDFNSQLDRMKTLMTYGRGINENNANKNYTLEYHKKAADGKTYGIVKECNKYYIKLAQDGKELVAENYSHIGGYMNKKNNEYDSYNKALKNFELKLSSINEACEGNVNIETLTPFRREVVLEEGTEKMKDEIARFRQIMYNSSMILNEECDYTVKGDGCYCDDKQPEAKTGKKGDEEHSEAKVVEQDKVKGTKGLDKKVGPFNVNPSKVNESCEGCCCDTDFDEGVDDGLNSEIGDGDPFVKHETVEGSVVNEEAMDTDFDEGMPSDAEAGVGEADTDHNNDPFNQSLNEEDEDDKDENLLIDDDETDDDFVEDDDIEISLDDDDDFVSDGEMEDYDDFADDDMDSDVELTDDEDVDADVDVDENDPEAVRAEIERLQSVLDNLDAEDNSDDEDAETDDDTENYEDDFDMENDDDFGDDTENDFEEDIYECGRRNKMYESKNAFMNSIVESVTRSILKEDELHVFGKHCGYRKKPMTLPSNGEDKNQWARDWNDDSVHGEKPFGEKVGRSDPYTEIVKKVTDDIMSQLTTTKEDKKKVK